jgi:hypothetical protein
LVWSKCTSKKLKVTKIDILELLFCFRVSFSARNPAPVVLKSLKSFESYSNRLILEQFCHEKTQKLNAIICLFASLTICFKWKFALSGICALGAARRRWTKGGDRDRECPPLPGTYLERGALHTLQLSKERNWFWFSMHQGGVAARVTKKHLVICFHPTNHTP